MSLYLTSASKDAIGEIVLIFAEFQDALAHTAEVCDVCIDAMLKLKSGNLDEDNITRMQKSMEIIQPLSTAADRMKSLEPLLMLVLKDLESQGR